MKGIALLTRAHDWLVRAMAVLAAAIIAAMVVLICADVAMRNLRLGTLRWSVELSEYGLYAMTLLGAPWVLALRGHVAMDLVAGAFSGMRRRVLDVLTCLVGALICAVLLWKGIDVTATSMQRGAMVRQVLVFPEWWLMALVPFAMGLLSLGFLRIAVEAALGGAGPSSGQGGH